jgi:hypothetical protein
LTPQYRLTVTPVAGSPGRHLEVAVRPDVRVTVSSRPDGRLRGAVSLAPSGGNIEIINDSASAISFQLSRGRVVLRRAHLRTRDVAWITAAHTHQHQQH